MKLFEIRARGATEADVFIYGDIGASWRDGSVEAAQFVRDLQGISAATLNVRMSSIGGSVIDGLAIYNALTRFPGTVNVFIDGVALSMASMIAMAGKTVTMAENAVMMIHGPQATAQGDAAFMREAADILDRYGKTSMAPAYAAKSGKPIDEILALLTDGKDHWYTAAEAQAAGFANEVSAPIAVTAQFDLARYKSPPAAAAAFFRSTNMPDGTNTAAPATPAANPQQPQPPAAAPVAAAPATPSAQPAAAAPTPAPAAVAAAPALAVVGSPRALAQNQEIRAAFQPFMERDGIRAAFDVVLMDPSITVEAARAQLLTALGKDVTPANPAGGFVQMGAAEGEKVRVACEEALIARAGYATPEIKARLGQNPYRGHKLLDICRASLERIRFDTRGLDQRQIVAAGFTQGTSDFPVLLENTMHKVLLAAYAITPDTWTKFCYKGTASDFRAQNRYRTGSFGSLDAVNELGEFKNKSIPDGEKSTITIGTKGNIINLSRQAVINDDLGAFVGLSADLGRAAKRSVEIDVFALLAENAGAGPTMSDGGALFNSTALTVAGGHANRAAYAAPTVLLVDAARQAMASQMDIGSNDFLALSPAIWLGKLSDGGSMRIINAAQYDPDTPNKIQRPNMVQSLFSSIVDSPRITYSAWYMFADPNIAPVIEVAFLDGNDQPFLEMQQGFEVDGAKWKVRLDYGVKERDFRGGYARVGS